MDVSCALHKTAKKLTLLGDDFFPNSVFTLRVLTVRVEPGFDRGYRTQVPRASVLKGSLARNAACHVRFWSYMYTFYGRHETFGAF